MEPDEIEAFRDSARDFLSREDHAARMRVQCRQPGVLDRERWQAMARVGWPAILIPEAQGGLGLAPEAMSVIAQEIGAALVWEPVLDVAVQAATLLAHLPGNALRDRLLEGIAAGALIAGTAWQQCTTQVEIEPGPMVRRDNDGFRIGFASFTSVRPGQGASGWLVLGSLGDEPMLFWVAREDPGVAFEDEPRVDAGSQGMLRLADCHLPEDRLVAQGAAVAQALARANDYMRIMQSAQLLGVARKAHETTLEYLKVRVQFGKPIGSFQSLQHRMVDAYIQLQLLDYALQEVLDQPDIEPTQLARQASRLKARAAQAAGQVTRMAVQMHGGMGYSDESDIGLMLKKALALSSTLGNERAHKARYVQLLRQQIRMPQPPVAQSDEEWDTFPKDHDWDAMAESDFRRMLRAFFRKHYPEHLRHRSRRLHWHEISGWYRTLSAQGWIAPSWPKQFGGMALSPEKMIAYIEEQERYGVGRPPDQGLVMLGPILIRYGTPQQQATYLPAILSGEHVWAQGYSEPNAGSDLASLRCEAVPDGDCFVVNGQKTWSTLAQDATHMFMLVRTDKSVKKQAGISFLMVDLQTPGIQRRPIRTIAGDEEYCEIFFDQVRVPKENLVGALNEGWTISKALLGFERLFSGNPKHAQNTLGMIDTLMARTGMDEDPVFLADYAQLHLDIADLCSAYAAFSGMVRRNQPLPPDVSLLKIWATETHEKAALLLLDAAGEHAGTTGTLALATLPQAQEPLLADIQVPLYNAAAAKIFSGTNEIQRNILAKVVLGLPT